MFIRDFQGENLQNLSHFDHGQSRSTDEAKKKNRKIIVPQAARE